jgi:hypothetical protein
VPGKVPSALELFLNYNSFNNTSNYMPAPSHSAPIMQMKMLWEDCTMQRAKYNICGKINDVTALFGQNYNDYKNIYNNNTKLWKKWGCTAPAVTLSEQLMLAHLYGWGPFNADSGCLANVNLLE